MRVAAFVSISALALAIACVPVEKPKEVIGSSPSAGALAPLPEAPIVFELESVDERSVSAPALHGRPAVLAFVVTDTLAGQAEASTLATLAQQDPDGARYVVVAVEPADRHELVSSFLRFFADKTHGQLLGAMADKDMLLGLGPFGDVRGLTVIILDKAGRAVFRKSGVVQASEITRALSNGKM